MPRGRSPAFSQNYIQLTENKYILQVWVAPDTLRRMSISPTQNAPAVGDVKTAALLTAVDSAKAQQASVLQLFDQAKAVPPSRTEDDPPPPPPRDSGRGRVIDRQA